MTAWMLGIAGMVVGQHNEVLWGILAGTHIGVVGELEMLFMY